MVRLKNRYLLVHILYPSTDSSSTKQAASGQSIPDTVRFHQPTSDQLTPQLLARTIKSEVSTLYGDYGVGVTASSLAVKYLSPATSTFILRVSRAHFRLVWAALSFLTRLPPSGTPCVMRVVRVSGTIKKAEEEAARRARQSMVAATAAVQKRLGEGLAGLLRDGGGAEQARDVEVHISEDEADDDDGDATTE